MKPNSPVLLSAFTLLVVNPKGLMRELYCPIRVQCIIPVGAIPPGTWVYVDELAFSAGSKLQYRISERWHDYTCFAIVISF